MSDAHDSDAGLQPPNPNSWVPSVNAESAFSLYNFPFGIASRTGNSESKDAGRVPVSAIGDCVIDLAAIARAGFFDAHLAAKRAILDAQGTLNAFMAAGRGAWRFVRRTLIQMFSASGKSTWAPRVQAAGVLFPLAEARMHLQANIGDYTDFYSSRYHAENVGTMFRGKDNALQPNWTWLPVGYHGRSSSVVISGTDLHRPRGQLISAAEPKKPPTHDVCRLMDFELEMAFFVGGPGNPLGSPIKMADAEKAIFGLVVMNDWSARDIQKWEYVPLGPFGGKNMGTSISPWIVTLDALAPFRIPNQKQDPAPLAYLAKDGLSAYDIKLDVLIQPEGGKEHVVSRSNASYLYWNFEQQLVHHSVTGCNMRPGDLLGSGTISGPDPSEYGSMLELCWKGTKEVKLEGSTETRKFLKNGDTVVMTGLCQGKGYRVGFGQVRGKVLPPVAL